MQPKESLSISGFVGVDLPPKEVSDLLLESYFASVHWFMMLFHETTFRAKYEALTSSRSVEPDQLNEVLLLLVVLAIGAKYVSKETMQARGLQCDFDSLQATFLARVAATFLEIVDNAGLEAVQICVLMSSHYLYHGKPNLGFVILGTGVRCAHSMDLHREATWKGLSEISREERKRVWWALYAFDR